MRRVAIIGGGITGLTVAHALERHNATSDSPIDYVLVEREDRLGGKMLTENVDGFLVEAGPDSFVSDKPWIPWMASELSIEDRLIGCDNSGKRAFVLSGGKVHELPEGLVLLLPTKIMPFMLSPLISWKGKARIGCDLFIGKKKEPGDETLGSFVRRRFGQEILDKVAGPLVGGIHANDPETMSLKASFPRFLKMEEDQGSLIKAMLSTKKKTAKPKSGQQAKSHFMSFEHGMGELADALAESIDSHRVLTGTMATGLEKISTRDGGGYLVRLDRGQKPLEVDAVVVATVSNQAARLLEGIDEPIASSLREIPLTSSASVTLAYKAGDLTGIPDGFGLVIPAAENRKISSFTISSTKWAGRVPNSNYALLRVFVGGYRNQELVLQDDDELIKMVRQELSDIFGISAKPVMTRIHRWVNERPQYVLNHLERVANIENRLAKHPGLFLAGCSYHGIGVGDCIASGVAASKKVTDLLGVASGERATV